MVTVHFLPTGIISHQKPIEHSVPSIRAPAVSLMSALTQGASLKPDKVLIQIP